MKGNLIVDLSYQFALEVMTGAKLIRERCEHDLASQLWRVGTSIGANIEEAQTAQSRADFRSKLSIAAKEARETHYWLRLSRDGKILSGDESAKLLATSESSRKILTSIVKSTGSSQTHNPASKIGLPPSPPNSPSQIPNPRHRRVNNEL